MRVHATMQNDLPLGTLQRCNSATLQLGTAHAFNLFKNSPHWGPWVCREQVCNMELFLGSQGLRDRRPLRVHATLSRLVFLLVAARAAPDVVWLAAAKHV